MSILSRLARPENLSAAGTILVPGPLAATQQPQRPPQLPLARLNPEPFDSDLNPLLPDLRPSPPARKLRGSDITISDTLTTTRKVYNAAMGDHLADPAAPIHDLRPSMLMRLTGHRWQAPSGRSEPPVYVARPQVGEVNYAAYDYEGRHGIAGRISQ